MARDSRITLELNPLNIGERFAQNIQNLQQTDLLNQRRDLAPIQLEQAQRANDLASQLTPFQIEQARRVNELQAAQQPSLLNQANLAGSDTAQAIAENQQQQTLDMQYAQSLKPFLDAGDQQGLISQIQKNKSVLSSHGIDTTGIDDDIAQVQTPEGFKALADEVNSHLLPQGAVTKSVSQREREAALETLNNDPKMETLAGKEAGVFLGIAPRAVGSAALTTANTEGQTETLGNSLAAIQTKVQTATEKAKTTGAIKTKVLKDATDFAENAANKLAAIPETNRIYQSAIEQIDAGANTGQIYDLLPTIDTNSIVLENIASKAGFDLAKSGGGIITDADMKFGLSTAIPRNLPPEELKAFLTKKIETQNKIAENLLAAVDFLGDGEHTIPQWYKEQKKRKKENQQKNNVIKFDAQGNRIQ